MWCTTWQLAYRIYYIFYLYHFIQQSPNSVSGQIQILHEANRGRREPLTMTKVGNKAACFSSVNHFEKKTIYHHIVSLHTQWQCLSVFCKVVYITRKEWRECLQLCKVRFVFRYSTDPLLTKQRMLLLSDGHSDNCVRMCGSILLLRFCTHAWRYVYILID